MAPMIGNMSVTEYVVMVLRLLRDQPGRAGFTLSEIETITGVVGGVFSFPQTALNGPDARRDTRHSVLRQMLALPCALQPSNGNVALVTSLRQNEKVSYDPISERYSYRARFAADDLYGLLRLLRNHERGLRLKDLEDAYPGEWL